MRKKYIPITLFVCLIMSCAGSKTAKVVVSNQSGWEIKSLTVGISGHEKTIRDLNNGDSANLVFRGLHDSHYTLKGRLSDGSVIHGDYGYVTNGMELSDSFVIYDGGRVEFKPGPH